MSVYYMSEGDKSRYFGITSLVDTLLNGLNTNDWGNYGSYTEYDLVAYYDKSNVNGFQPMLRVTKDGTVDHNDPAATPEPATFLIFGAALIGLPISRRFRKR
ncbi:MAG: PEP-CTERM sorting domain-containing protein [Thermoguttaceae bacterium]